MLRTLLFSLMIGLFLTTQSVMAAPKSDLWEVWLKHASQKGETVDHSAWQSFLDRYLQLGNDGITRVDYKAVKKDDRKQLADYLRLLQGSSPLSLNRDQQRAYWINLYNAGTVQVILMHYPIKSIRDIDISPGWFEDGPWGKKLFKIEGYEVSLNDIEHRILRPIWQDPRLHYALNCASLGCPNLQPSAFTAENSETLLNQAATSFINHRRAVNVEGGELELSSIYRWFKEDFGGSDRMVIHHLKQFAKPALAAQLNEFNEIDDYQYDWSLNEVLEK